MAKQPQAKTSQSAAATPPDNGIVVGKSDKPEVLDSQVRQPPRPGHRRHRHRQDRDAAGAGRRLLARRRAGLRRRRQGRPLRHRRGRRGQGRLRQARQGASASTTTSPPRSRRSSGTCSASRATRSAPPSRRWGRCCCRACWSSTTRRRACSTSPSASPTSRACCCSTSRTCARCCTIVAEHAGELTDRVRQRLAGRPIGTIQRQLLVLEQQGGDQVLRRAGARHQRPHAHRRATAAAMINVLAADKLMQIAAALRDVPALAAVGAVRGAARGRRSGQAEARVLLRRGASAVQRRAQGAARQDRAGGAADPLQGRRRLFRHAEPARRARHRAGASSATACSMRCAPSRRATRRRCKAAAETFRPNPKLDTAQVITELGKGEALVSFLEGNGIPVDGRAHADPAAVGAHRADHAGGAQGDHRQEPGQRQVRHRRSTAKSAYEILQKRVARTERAPAAPRQAARPAPDRRRRRLGRPDRRRARRHLRHQPPARPAALAPAQLVAREVTRTVTNRVAGQVAADIGKSLGGSIGGSIGRAIVRGALGGILRR